MLAGSGPPRTPVSSPSNAASCSSESSKSKTSKLAAIRSGLTDLGIAERPSCFFVDWDVMADDITAALRIDAGKHPRDSALNELIGGLAAGSQEFATRWARHDVRLHRSTRKRLHSKLVGNIELTGDALELPGEDLTLIAYTAEAGSPAQQQLDILASWTAEPHDISTGTPTATQQSD